MSHRAGEKCNLTAVWKLAGEKEMLLWLWIYSQDLLLSLTQAYSSSVGYFGEEQTNEWSGQTLWKIRTETQS